MLSSLPSVKTTSKPEAAMEYARLGLPVFPCQTLKEDGTCTCGDTECRHPGKHPLPMPTWARATTDPGVVHRWWRRQPWANIATPTGRDYGLVVLDIDVLESLEEVESRFPGPGAVSLTGGGGMHYYFEAYKDRRRVGSENVAPGVAMMADHPDPAQDYYVLLPPSTTTGRYSWA